MTFLFCLQLCIMWHDLSFLFTAVYYVTWPFFSVYSRVLCDITFSVYSRVLCDLDLFCLQPCIMWLWPFFSVYSRVLCDLDISFLFTAVHYVTWPFFSVYSLVLCDLDLSFLFTALYYVTWPFLFTAMYYVTWPFFSVYSRVLWGHLRQKSFAVHYVAQIWEKITKCR
jgi:hypothetical protein